MHVLTQFGADLRPRRRLHCRCASGRPALLPHRRLLAKTPTTTRMAQHSERFSFTGSYRFWLTPTAKSQTGPKPGSDSRQTDRSRPARHEATTQPPTEDSKAGIASVSNGSIAPAPQIKPNARNKARLSRDTRSSLGVTPNDRTKADAIAEPAQARLPVFAQPSRVRQRRAMPMSLGPSHWHQPVVSSMCRPYRQGIGARLVHRARATMVSPANRNGSSNGP